MKHDMKYDMESPNMKHDIKHKESPNMKHDMKYDMESIT